MQLLRKNEQKITKPCGKMQQYLSYIWKYMHYDYTDNKRNRLMRFILYLFTYIHKSILILSCTIQNSFEHVLYTCEKSYDIKFGGRQQLNVLLPKRTNVIASNKSLMGSSEVNWKVYRLLTNPFVRSLSSNISIIQVALER